VHELRVTIYRNRRTGEFRVHPHANHFGSAQEFGAPTVLSPSVTDAKFLQVILEIFQRPKFRSMNWRWRQNIHLRSVVDD
jgi:hypothetical protein